jgi:Putative prokaryotic signal transducing protein
MREMLRSNDAVLLSYAESVLQEMGITSLIADQHISVIEGSIGAFPRRLLVKADEWFAARRALRDAGLEAWLIADGEVHA